MKKFFSIMLVSILMFSLFACGKDVKTEKTVNDKVSDAVKSQIILKIALQYNTVGVPTITTFVQEKGNNKFEVTGKITVKDKYGDKYTGKYDAEVTYDPELDKCKVSLEIDDLYKEK